MKRTAFASLAALAAGGCVSVLPQPDIPTALYDLPAPTAQGALAFEGSVLITEPDASGLFGGKSVVVDGAEGGLAVLRSVQWSDRATRLLQTALLDQLVRDGGPGIAMADSVGARADHDLRWRLSDYSVRNGVARARATVTLLDARTRQPLAQKDIATSAPVTGDRPADDIRALRAAGQALVSDVALFVADAL